MASRRLLDSSRSLEPSAAHESCCAPQAVGSIHAKMKAPKAERFDTPFYYLSRIQRASRLAAEFIERAGRDLDLTGPEAHVLGYVHSRPGSPLPELLRVFGFKRSTLTSILDRLDSRGLIRRKSSPKDRRSFLVHVTPTGRRTARRAQRVAVDLERRIAALVLPRDAAALDRLLDAVMRATGGAPLSPLPGLRPRKKEGRGS